MSSYRQICNYGSYSPCDVSCPEPYANAWSEPCVTSCGDSRAVVYPPPVTIIFPGPILTSCTQESFVGTSAPLEIGSSFGSGASLGSRYSYSCYSHSCGIYHPAKPCYVFQQEQGQFRKL